MARRPFERRRNEDPVDTGFRADDQDWDALSRLPLRRLGPIYAAAAGIVAGFYEEERSHPCFREYVAYRDRLADMWLRMMGTGGW